MLDPDSERGDSRSFVAMIFINCPQVKSFAPRCKNADHRDQPYSRRLNPACHLRYTPQCVVFFLSPVYCHRNTSTTGGIEYVAGLDVVRHSG